ncbi:response regulator transcription factor [Microvirga aerilata]|uniref:Response regulator transcription factor n=1 Tax=Microvirga aerilata TaxID=670292 RepID=A0A936Z9R7_9HYPH|nr:response regulator transcription factor [Microvirga aerilata]MBL0406551.1 response regulator transcription factor [Microvirga aerilata]
MERLGKTALIADPNEFYRLGVGTLLTSRLGFGSVVEAAFLDEALDRLAEVDGISLALFDLALPDVKSAACLAAVRQCFPQTKTVVLSFSDRKQDILTALEAGVHGFIPKRMKPAELTSALDLILRGQIYVPSSVTALSSPSMEMQQSHDTALRSSSTTDLTPRQREVLTLLVQGKSNKEIAKTLNLGEGTVKVHMAALFRTFGVNSRAAVAVAGLHLTGKLILQKPRGADRP